MKSRTFETLWHILRSRSEQQPLILVVEDLHWVDQSSQDFFTMLVENLTGSAILLLATYRPGYQPPWIGKSYVTQMALPRLTSADSLEVVYSVLQQETLPQVLAQMILDKADGNPLFWKSSPGVEQKAMQGDATVPDTIQGVLMARIDRLPDAPKRMLQAASVLGRAFSAHLLRALWDEPEDLEMCLGELKRLEFLYEENRGEEPVYVFRHALTQDVAYDSLLTRRRQRLHATAAHVLERLYAEHLEDAYDRLAYHYSKAEDATKAVMYLTRFAEKAAREHAHVEAILALQGALAHSERLPIGVEHTQLRLDLHWRLAFSLCALGRYQETLERLRQQQDHLAQLQDAALAGRYALLQSQTASYLGDWPQAAQSAQEAIEAAEHGHEEPILGQAAHVLAMERYWTGYPAQGVEYSQRAIAALAGIGEDYRLGMAHFVLALNALSLGRFDDALEAAARAGAIGEALLDRRLQPLPPGPLAGCRPHVASGTRPLPRASGPWKPRRIPSILPLPWDGWATPIWNRETPLQPCRRWSRRCRVCTSLATGVWKGCIRPCSAKCISWAGTATRHGTWHSQGLVIASETPYRTGTAWAQRALGRIAQADGDFAAAEHCLNEALTTFTAMQARFEVGRTHLALAALAQLQGNRDAITLHLSAAHHLFTVSVCQCMSSAPDSMPVH